MKILKILFISLLLASPLVSAKELPHLELAWFHAKVGDKNYNYYSPQKVDICDDYIAVTTREGITIYFSRYIEWSYMPTYLQ